MKKDSIVPSRFWIILPIGLLSFLLIISQWQTVWAFVDDQWNAAVENERTDGPAWMDGDEKQRGAHVFGKLDSTNLQALLQSNIEWVTLVSWGYQDDIDSPTITHYNTTDSLQVLQHNLKLRKRIELVRAAGFKVFFKPHLWINNPAQRSRRADIMPTKPEDWALWQKSYRQFILGCAAIAEQTDVDMFCVGTELTSLTTEKPDFWKNLIEEVRSIYTGKITYAANWYQEFEAITFWEALDYVGIQAYFPLVDHKYPTAKQISRAWNQHIPVMASLHKKYNRKILFTEMGYKSTADSAIKPWEWVEDPRQQNSLFSAETQGNCYEAFFNTVWEKEWFAGVHIWQYRGDYRQKAGKKDLGFTPQGKPAEAIIAEGFQSLVSQK